MKKKLFKLFAGLCLSFVLISFTSGEGDERQNASKSKFITYLGCAITDSVFVDKNLFDSLVALPICAKDSNNNYCKVQSFEITYAERGLYQDSTGLPIVVTDYSSVTCKGDTIPTAWKQIFHDRSYKGDTIYFDKIIAKSPDQKMRLCKGLKFVIK